MSDGALLITLEALGRETKRVRLTEASAGERVMRVERDALFNEHKALDRERDIVERDRRISDLVELQQLLAPQLRELEQLRKQRANLEQQVYDRTRQVKALEERLSVQSTQLTAHFAAHLGQMRETALANLESNVKKLYGMLPADNVEINEVLDAMRLVVAKVML